MARKKQQRAASAADPHVLYTAAVQSVDADLDFAVRAFRRRRGRRPLRLREDFCGTARIACEWAARGADHEAWGVDLDRETLDWGRAHYLERLGEAARRVHLVHGNVLTARTPPADIAVALNFSYCVFKQRALLRRYLRNAYRRLNADGMFYMDVFGGSGALEKLREDRVIKGETDPEGRRIPRFKFVWEQRHFNMVTNEIECHIHFKLKNGKTLRRAFSYDWRLWSIAELRDLLDECGFAHTDVYTHGWDEDGESDGVYRRVTRMENAEGWLAYVVAYK